MKNKTSVIFMGTPHFAVPTLEALHISEFRIDLVVTQPDRPKGRGRQSAPSPVKMIAQSHGYPVYQPERIRDEQCIQHLKMFNPDFMVVVAFGQILPKAVLSIPKQGAVNVHASLLPKYRGPAPIQWAILRGEKQTGVTTMLMDIGVDTGDILLKTQTPITAEDTSTSLHDRLARLGASLLVETLYGLSGRTLFPRAQPNRDATYAPMLSKKDGHINWSKTATELDAFVRAMTPWPGAFCFLGEKRYRILKACAVHDSHTAQPGAVISGFADELRIATGKDSLSILEIQSDSGKSMAIKQFLHGHPIALDSIFT